LADLADALAECLDAMRRNGDLEECLRRHPEHREELLSLLEVARKIRPLPPADALPGPSRESAARFLERLRALERRPDAGP